MSTQEAIHKRNLESSILFMQRDHAATLKALHEEIQKLQKKCTDLTFELNMAGLDLGRNIPPDVQEHIKHLEKMIDNQRETHRDLEMELDKKNKLLQANEYTYKLQKMKHVEELRTKNQELEQLRADLDIAANSNAYYQNELLKIKKEKLSNNGATRHDSHESSVHAPVPPMESRSIPKRSFHIRRTLVEESQVEEKKELSDVHPASGGTGRIGSGSSGHSSSSRELVKPFLHHEEQEHEVIQIKQTNPLPPIRTSSGRVVFREPVDVVHVRVHNVPKPHRKSKLSGTITQEVQTLAIGPVSHSDQAWAHQQRKESHSSEYH